MSFLFIDSCFESTLNSYERIFCLFVHIVFSSVRYFPTLSCVVLSLNCFWFILSWQLGIFFYCVLLFRYITALLFHLIPLSFIHALFCLFLSAQLFLCICFICLSHISKISCDLEFLSPMFSKHFLSYFIIALKVVVIISMSSPGGKNFH